MDSAAEPDYLSTEELEELQASLTMLDVYRARKSPDKTEVGLRAYLEAAQRTRLIGSEVTLEEFLVRIRADDFNRIMSPGTSRAGLPNSPRPESIGEESQGSSGTTDTGLETSSS